MSGFSSEPSIWVSDLDCYISIDSIDYWNNKEIEEQKWQELYESTENIELLGGEAMKPPWLNDKKISTLDWEFELYRAKRHLQEKQDWQYLEPLLIKALLSEGRKYAVRRYAKTEKIPVNAAITATLPSGLHALLSQFFTQHQIILSKIDWENLLVTVQNAVNSTQLTAYSKTTLVRNEIFSRLDRTSQHQHSLELNRNLLRIILSLVRLYFSAQETKVTKFSALMDIENRYKIQGEEFSPLGPSYHPTPDERIKNWNIRHLRSLLYYYPYVFRHAIVRGYLQSTIPNDKKINQKATNELALIYCASNIFKRKRNDGNK